MTDDPRDEEMIRRLSTTLPGVHGEPGDLERIRSGIRRRKQVRWGAPERS
jgi:hypothetical protein